MPRPTRVLLAAVLSVAALAGCAGGDVSARPGGQNWIDGDGSVTFVAPGDRKDAPTVKGDLLDEGSYDVSTLDGQVVVLNFWASWCPPCRAEAPALEQVYEATKADGVQFVGVNMRDTRKQAKRFADVRGTSYPSLYDQPGTVAARFRGTLPPVALPSTVVLDRQGRIAVRVLGGVTASTLQPIVERVAAERA